MVSSFYSLCNEIHNDKLKKKLELHVVYTLILDSCTLICCEITVYNVIIKKCEQTHNK